MKKSLGGIKALLGQVDWPSGEKQDTHVSVSFTNTRHLAPLQCWEVAQRSVSETEQVPWNLEASEPETKLGCL